MSALDEAVLRGMRVAIIGSLLETIPDREGRISLLERLSRANIITKSASDMLVDAYEL